MSGDFLAVAGNKWNGGATIEQLYRGADLLLINFDFCGDLPDDFLHEWRMSRESGRGQKGRERDSRK